MVSLDMYASAGVGVLALLLGMFLTLKVGFLCCSCCCTPCLGWNSPLKGL